MTQSGTPSDPTQSTPQSDAQQTQAQPSTDTAPTEQHGFTSELLAYQVIDNLGDIIAERVRQKLDTTGKKVRLLLVSDLEQALGGMPLEEIQGQISLTKSVFAARKDANERLLEKVDELVMPPPKEPDADIAAVAEPALIPAIGGITGMLPDVAGMLADVVALFRSDYEFTGRSFEVKDPAILASVAGNLVNEGISVLIPGFFLSKSSTILADLAELGHQAAHLQTQRDALVTLLPKTGETEEPKQEKADESDQTVRTLPPSLLADIPAAVRDTDATLLSFSGFRTSWTIPPQGQTQTKLEKALVRERIETLGISHLLWLGNLSSGGESIVRKGLLVTDSIVLMGGTAVSFVLADENGEVLDGSTYAQYGLTGGKLKDYLDHDMTARCTPEY